MKRHLIALAAAGAVALALAGLALGFARHSGTTTPQRFSAARAAGDPLVGTWDTGPIPLAKIRAALSARGYSASQISHMFQNFHMSKSWEWNLSFYRENGAPFQILRNWDPTTQTKPVYGDHGPYKLLPNHRFVARGVDPPTNTFLTTFSYTASGTRLTLHFISLVEPAVSKGQALADQKRGIVEAVAPYKKVG
jgi:hypothetical protein